MNVITGLDITASNLTSSTVAEPDAGEVLWNAATNYTLGTVVIRTTTHKKYENVLAGVDATTPEASVLLETGAHWIEIGPTNKYAMFDTLRNTQTIAPSPLTVTLTPGVRVDAIAVMAMEAESITISMMNGPDTVYSYTQNLNTREVLDWYDYFFEPFSTIPSVAKFDLPPYTSAVTTITLTSSTGTVSCGAVVIGNQTYIGETQHNAVSDAINFSKIERAFDGTSLLLQRRSIPKVTATIFADKPKTNKIRALRTDLNAVPAVWSGLDDQNTDAYFEAILILGIYKTFTIDIAHPEKTIVSLEVEEI